MPAATAAVVLESHAALTVGRAKSEATIVAISIEAIAVVVLVLSFMVFVEFLDIFSHILHFFYFYPKLSDKRCYNPMAYL
jgi:hypothetical protein